MQEWLAIKGTILASTGLDRGALQVIGGLALAILFGIVLRRPLTQVAPWLAVAMVALADECITGFADDAFNKTELTQALADLLSVLSGPTLLLLLCRYAPVMLVGGRRDQRIVVAAGPLRTDNQILDAEFEEVD